MSGSSVSWEQLAVPVAVALAQLFLFFSFKQNAKLKPQYLASGNSDQQETNFVGKRKT
jgi:hypothetical protein